MAIPREQGNDDPVFQLLILADLLGQKDAPASAPVPVDKGTFEPLLDRMAPKVHFIVPNQLTGTGQLPVDLTFRAMRDFSPLEVLERTEGCRAYLQCVRQLAAVARGEATFEAIDPALAGLLTPAASTSEIGRADPTASGRSPGAEPAKEPKDNLFASVGMPEESDGANTAVDEVVKNLQIPRQKAATAVDREHAAKLLTELRSRLHRQLNAILHHPAFQAVESAWRGLQFLLTHVDPQGARVKLWVISARRDNLPKALNDALTHLSAAGMADGVDATLLDFAFDPTEADLALIRETTTVAEMHYCPVVAAASLRMLGVQKPDLSDLPRSLRARFDAPELIPWREFSRSPLAEFVALTIPAAVGRFPYGPKTTPVPDLEYVERDGVLWMNGPWLVGAAMVRSAARTGWALSIAGMEHGRFDALPLAPDAKGGATMATTQIVWTDDQVTDLARGRLVVLAGGANQARAHIAAVPTLFEPPPTANTTETREADLHATLPYRLFADKIARRLAHARTRLSPDLSEGQIENVLMEAIGSLFDHPQCVQAQVGPCEDEPTRREIILQIHPSFTILGRDAELLLSAELEPSA